MDSTAEAFRQAIVTAGLTPPQKIIPDGKIHRFPTNGTTDDDSGWFVLYPDGVAAGAFGDWRTGLRRRWSAKSERSMSRKERTVYALHLDSIKRQRQAEDARRQTEVAAKACRIWGASKPAPDDHAYLSRKMVSSHGLRLSRDGRLIVPLRNLTGEICSLEFIDVFGQKRFLSGGSKRGRFFVFGDMKGADWFCLTEGWATGASVYEASGRPTVVAFDAGNLLPVARAIRSKWQNSKILVCADNDESGVGQNAAQKAAQAVGGCVVIPERTGDDWNDLGVREGRAAVGARIDAALHFDVPTSRETRQGLNNATAWCVPDTQDPAPISLETIELPALPTDCIPVPWLRDMIHAVSANTETPAELACLLSLSVVATAVQRAYCIEPERGYVEHLALWCCVALESGARKTAVIKALTRPLLAHERHQSAAIAQAVRDAEAARIMAEDRIKHLRHKAARATGADLDKMRAALRQEEEALPEVPREPRLWCQDVTPERLGQLMADHGDAMSILSDEGGIFDILAGRYSQGIPNLDLILQSYSGAPHRVDRGSRPAVFLQSPVLTIGLSPQPSVLQALSKQANFRGRGLLARFFYAVPPTTLGFRELIEHPIPEGVEARYDAGVTALLEKPLPSSDLRRIHFTSEAYAEWKAFQRRNETEMRPSGAFENLRDWGSKVPGGAARLAGILHCARYAEDDPVNHPVDMETTTAALMLAAVLGRHAIAAFSLMALDSGVQDARRVWEWIRQGRHHTFSRRDLFNALRGSFSTVESLRPALAVLEERGYIFPDNPPAPTGAKKAGRPRHLYRVNSRLATGWQL
ncbi:MAG: DUF3987 domain-containing protein [Nitrospira sp.]|nr:DUF3987 domain-containing protein [Nitrospira sp.]